MFLDRLTPAWQSLRRRLRQQCTVAIAHPDAALRDELAEELLARDIRVDLVATDDWPERAADDDIGIGVTGHGMLGPTSEAADWFLVCSDHQPDATEALRRGATDVTLCANSQKRELIQRLSDRVDDYTARRLLTMVVDDMSSALKAEGISGAEVAELETRLQAYRMRLGKRPALAVVDRRKRAATRLADELRLRLSRQVVATIPDSIERAAGGPVCPLVGLLPAVMPGARQLATTLRQSRSQIELLVMAPRSPQETPNLEWSDWIRTDIDDQDVIAARAKLLYRRTRQRLLYQQLLMALTDALATRPRRSTGDSLYDRVGYDGVGETPPALVAER